MQQQHRQLAAILFTDIVGYTALMQENEQQAVALIKHYNTALNQLVSIHNGRVLNYYGDGSLCSFPSVTEALNCAISLQKELQSVPPVPLRIGLHVGEVFFEEEKALGDGVNVASRIQSLGQANSILFSKEIFDKIRNRPEFKSVSLGIFEFKNVQEPLEVFALATEGLHIPQKETLEGKLKGGLPNNRKSHRSKIVIAIVSILLLVTAFLIYSSFFQQAGFTGKEKSIAVLPFNNMSNEKDNEYFSDGITEEITNQLAKIANLKVIARTSSMLYKGSKKSIKEIAEELGVASVLQGSVQKSGNVLRISAQLIDARTQENIWTEKYDREFKDVFVIQSEVAQNIAYQLNTKLTKSEKAKIEKVPTKNLQAYEYYLQGYQVHQKFYLTSRQEDFNTSKEFFEKAIKLDSNYALAHAALADLYNTYTNLIKKDSVLIDLQVKEINIANAIDPDLDYIGSVKGNILISSLGNIEEGYNILKNVFVRSPNYESNLFEFAGAQMRVGLIDEATPLLDRAIKLNPLSGNNFAMRAYNKFLLNKIDEAIRDEETTIKLEPGSYSAMEGLAFFYTLQGRLKEAEDRLAKSLKGRPVDKVPQALAAYCYARLGDKKKALQYSPDWRVFLVLGMKEDALKNLIRDDSEQIPFQNDYLYFKNHLSYKEFDIIRDDPRFKALMEKKRMQYEINKKKFSIAGLLNEPSSTK